MNSAFEGLRPTVGLRRPGRCLLRRRRPTPGAQRPERPISIGGKAFGHRPACAPNDFGLGRPSANGRPAPTEKVSSASAKADARRAAPGEADFNRRERPSAIGRPVPTGKVSSASAKADARRAAPGEADFNRREGLQPTVGLRRPRRCLLRRQRPTPGAERLQRPISIGGRAFGHRSACADREISFASAKADARRAAPGEADFNRREGLRPSAGVDRNRIP